MKRLALALILGAALALVPGLPASAQYGGGGGGTTTTSSTSTTQPGGGQPSQPRISANVSDDDVEPGDPVTVTTPPAFAPGTPVTVSIARAQQGTPGSQVASGNADSNGNASESFTVPALEDGVYWVYVTGVDADGNPVVALTPIVVRNGEAAPAAAAVEGETFQAAAAAPVPAAVAELQTVSPDTEAAVVDAVTDGAGVALSPQGTLQVRSASGALQDASELPRTGADAGDISQQVTIGAAMLLAGTGLVLLRRRRGGFTK